MNNHSLRDSENRNNPAILPRFNKVSDTKMHVKPGMNAGRVTIKDPRILRLPTKHILRSLSYIRETPTLGEQYTRTYLLKHPERIDRTLRPDDLAGIEVTLTNHRRLDMLYIKHGKRSLRFFVVEAKDALPNNSTKLFKRAKKTRTKC